MFQFELCRKLGWRSVKEMRAGLDWREYVQWQAYRKYKFDQWESLTDRGKDGQLWDGW